MLDACTGCCKNWLWPGSSIPGHSDVVTVASTGTDGDGDHPHVDLAFGPCMWTLHVDIVCYLAAHKQRESVHDGGHVISYWSRRHAAWEHGASTHQGLLHECAERRRPHHQARLIRSTESHVRQNWQGISMALCKEGGVGIWRRAPWPGLAGKGGRHPNWRLGGRHCYGTAMVLLWYCSNGASTVRGTCDPTADMCLPVCCRWGSWHVWEHSWVVTAA